MARKKNREWYKAFRQNVESLPETTHRQFIIQGIVAQKMLMELMERSKYKWHPVWDTGAMWNSLIFDTFSQETPGADDTRPVNGKDDSINQDSTLLLP